MKDGLGNSSTTEPLNHGMLQRWHVEVSAVLQEPYRSLVDAIGNVSRPYTREPLHSRMVLSRHQAPADTVTKHSIAFLPGTK